jgi:hypothetical protein
VISLVTKDAKIDLMFRLILVRKASGSFFGEGAGRQVKGEEATPPGFHRI